MQHKNPVDIELVAASDEALTLIQRIAEHMGIQADSGIPARLQAALYAAKGQMQAQEDEENSGLFATQAPTSMD